MKKKIILSFWIISSFVVFFSSIQEQLILNDTLKRQVNTIFPEGWGFFTKSPRDFHLEVFKLDANLLNLVTIKNQSLYNYIGFSRKTRVIGYEASLTANEIDPKFWIEINAKDFNKTIEEIEIVEIEVNPEFKYFNKGIYILKLFKITPFAWAKDGQELNAPIKIVKIKII